MLRSGYFDRAQTHPNGTCQEEEEQERPPVVAESQDAAQPSEPGTDYMHSHECIHAYSASPTSVFVRDFILCASKNKNRSFILHPISRRNSQ